MSRMAGLFMVLGLVLLTRTLLGDATTTAADAALGLGFVLITAYLAGLYIRRFQLPSVTGYLLTGMLCGPFLLSRTHPVLAVLNQPVVDTLRLLDAVALGMIALNAGGRLRIATVQGHLHTILAVAVLQVAFVSLAVGTLVYFGGGYLGMGEIPPVLIPVLALLFGVIATANSPATALAVIQEYKASGPVTDVVLAVTVVKDVVVITLFTLTLSLASLMLNPQEVADAAGPALLAWEVLGSILAGLLLGWLVALYMERMGHEVPLLVLGVSFLSVTALPALHLSGMLALMIAGATIENFSPHGEALLRAVERHSLPVFVVFFTIAGASLNLDALWTSLPFALSLMLTRLAGTYLGTASGASLSNAPRSVRNYSWSGFVAQAGVSLGFLTLVGQRLPEVAPVLTTGVLALIALNQVLGPVLFRFGLAWSGETKETP